MPKVVIGTRSFETRTIDARSIERLAWATEPAVALRFRMKMSIDIDEPRRLDEVAKLSPCSRVRLLGPQAWVRVRQDDG
jgi:hypothetical protein